MLLTGCLQLGAVRPRTCYLSVPAYLQAELVADMFSLLVRVQAIPTAGLKGAQDLSVRTSSVLMLPCA